MSKSESIRRFQKAVMEKFGDKTNFSHHEADPSEDMPERIEVAVPTDDIDWASVSPGVLALLRSSGASDHFEFGGSGLGFGYRDISLYLK